MSKKRFFLFLPDKLLKVARSDKQKEDAILNGLKPDPVSYPVDGILMFDDIGKGRRLFHFKTSVRIITRKGKRSLQTRAFANLYI